ncbi:MAG: WYL domain-containing protein [Oscillospiraceae bacterium]|nr:WYL domain-containing protein [Oscillospiraceae bacterium]
MAGFSELIKSFDKTRDYVRDFFIYGCKVRNDFQAKSSRTYDDEKRRVESWLGDYIHTDNSQRGKKVCISVDSGHISENPLYKAYYSKSFTDNDIKLHFLLTDILADGESLTLKELVNRLADDYGELFDEQTVRNKLKEYADEGVFVKEKQGKTDYFRLSEDTAESFFNEYAGLDNAVKFASEAGNFGVVGNSLLKSAGLKNDIILNKHNYIVHTLEDEVMLDIVSAIDEKRFITFESFGKNREGKTFEYSGVPFRILSSMQTGRRYLTMYNYEYRRYNSVRLDSIKSVKQGEICPDYDEMLALYLKNEQKCFGVSFGRRTELGHVEPIKLTIFADEKTEDYIINRLEREKRCGTVEHVSENTFVFSADVFDPNEIMQWAKSFIGRIISVEGGSEEIRNKFYNDIERMNRMYCDEKED